MSRVCSHNEWDPLEEVIVGIGVPSTLPALEFSFKLFFHDNVYGKLYGDGMSHSVASCNQYITKQLVEEHNEDVENFALLLQGIGITVRRPKMPKKVYKIQTPWWESGVYPALNTRDLSMVVGNEIIESSSTCRWRYFETDFLKHLFHEYFISGAKWTCAPRPLVLDSSFDLSYILGTNQESKDYYTKLIADDDHYMKYGYEIMFDAANCIRLGTHILMNASNRNAKLGAEWLQRHLGSKYKVLTTDVADTHIDSTILPLRPGLAITTRPDIKKYMPEELQSWEYIYVAPIDRPTDRYDFTLASPRIDLNVLSISPDCIICHSEYETVLSKQLKPYGIEVIPSQMRHCEIFAGAHHCVTLDIRRAGSLEDYFA